MFVTKKRFDQMMKSGDDLLAQRAAQALRDSETIGRLQRENARLLSELAELKAKRARANANLIPGGRKKKAAVMAERAGSVG